MRVFPKLYKRKGCKNLYIKIKLSNGKRRPINLGTDNPQEAKRRAKKEYDFNISEGQDGIEDKITFKDAIKFFLVLKKGKREGTTKRYKEMLTNLQNFLLDKYPHIKQLSQIITRHISEYIDLRRDAGIAEKTLKDERDLFAHFFKLLKANGYYLKQNPLNGVETIEPEESEPRWFSDDEMAKILNYCKEHNGRKSLYYEVYKTLRFTGMRVGELRHLTHDDVDLKRGRIYVKSKPEVGWLIKKGYTRVIPIRKEILPILKQLKDSNGSKWLFSKSNNSQISRNQYWDYLKKILRECGIPDGKLHSLRHSFGAWITREGLSEYARKKLMGHDTKKTMTDRYSHLAEDEIIEMIQKIKATDLP